MLRHAVFSLTKLSSSELSRLLTGVQPRCLWQGTKCLQANKSGDSSSSSSSSDSDSDSDSEKRADVDNRLKSAAEAVAKAVPGQSSAVKSDLLQQLQHLASQSKAQAKGEQPQAAPQVSDLFSGMKVIKKGRGQDQAMGEGKQLFKTDRPQIDRREGRIQGALQAIQSREKVKLFEGPGLGIFTDSADTKQSTSTDASDVQRRSLWEMVQQEQLELFAKQPPTNAFEEMIQWTQEGKLWKFPIDNEQGMEEEKAVGFHEHIFLEDQIQDFPHRGPIRHFMELVIVGLSKNPHLTVQQKHEHIDWFRQYFKEKQSVLEEAFGEDGVMQSAKAS